MKETPTSGPVSRSITQKARAESSSRHSFSSSQVQGALGEGKEDLFEIRGPEGALGVASPPPRSIPRSCPRRRLALRSRGRSGRRAAPRRRSDGWTGRACSRSRVSPQSRRHFAGLLQVEAVERFVHEEQGLRGEEAHGQQDALALPLGQFLDPRGHERLEGEALDHFIAQRSAATEEANHVLETEANGLSRPGRDGIGQVEGLGIIEPGSRTLGQDSGEAFEERGLPAPFGPIRPSTSPGRMEKLTRSSARRLPYVFDTSDTRRASPETLGTYRGAAVVLPAPVGPRAIFGIEACAQRG